MNDLSNNFNFCTFSEIESEIADSIIKEIDPNSDKNNGYQRPKPIEGQNFDEHYRGKLVRQPQYKNCTFSKVNFDGIDGISSSVIDCRLFSSNFKDAGLDYSDFSATHFLRDTTIINCGCSNCNFTNSHFRNTYIESTTFSHTFFINTVITDTIFMHCSFEDAIFDNATLENAVLTQASLEFTTFHNVKFRNVTLPFWGILKSFNGLQNISVNSDEITIQSSINAKKLSAKEFMEILNTLQPYFYKRHEYFILTNISIFLGHQNNALKYMLEGLRYNLDIKDFRMIRYLCQLASNNHFFTREQLHIIYNVLIVNDNLSLMNNHEYQIYVNELDSIKRLLIDNPYSMPQMVITYKTTFAPHDYEALVTFLKFIDNSIQKYVSQCSYYLAIRRNSPPIIETFISDVLPNLYNYFFIVTTIIIGMNKGVSMFKEALEAKGVFLDNKSKEQVLELQELEMEQKRLENIKLKGEIDKQKEEATYTSNQIKKSDLILESHIQENIESIEFSIKSVHAGTIPIREYTVSYSENNYKRH